MILCFLTHTSTVYSILSECKLISHSHVKYKQIFFFVLNEKSPNTHILPLHSRLGKNAHVHRNHMAPVPFVGVAIFSTSGYWAPTPWLSLQILSLSAMQKAADLEKVYPRRIWEVCVPILFGSENFRRGNVTENVKKAAELLNHVNGRHASSRKGTTK